MKWPVIALIAVGIIVALSAMILVVSLRADMNKSRGLQGAQDVQVVVAIKDINTMDVVLVDAVDVRQMTRADAPKEYLSHPAQVVGKVLAVSMVTEQPFTRACFATEGSGMYLASALPKGMRAITISLSDYAGLEGLLYPGGIVDVLVALKAFRSTREAASTTLLERVQVLAVGKATVFSSEEDSKLASSGRNRKTLVTLMVNAKQAEILQLAMKQGTVSLTLRNPTDAAESSGGVTTFADLTRANRNISGNTSQLQGDLTKAVTSLKNALMGTSASDLWRTLIIRGSSQETKSFPLPEENVTAP